MAWWGILRFENPHHTLLHAMSFLSIPRGLLGNRVAEDHRNPIAGRARRKRQIDRNADATVVNDFPTATTSDVFTPFLPPKITFGPNPNSRPSGNRMPVATVKLGITVLYSTPPKDGIPRIMNDGAPPLRMLEPRY